MHWKFEPFFSIEILHGKYPPPAVGQPAPPAPVFSVEPSAETKDRLLRMGWIFKPYPSGGGGVLYAEKIISRDGTSKLRVRPASGEGFSFLLHLIDMAVLQNTMPYKDPTSSFPAFSGRARLLYFDNLNPVNAGPNTFLLTAGNSVSFPDFASRIPTSFIFRPTSTTVTQVEMASRSPGGLSKVYSIDTTTKSAEITLPENAYRLTQQPVNQSEIVYLTNEQLPPSALGVARIFQPKNAEWEPFRRYQIMFDKI